MQYQMPFDKIITWVCRQWKFAAQWLTRYRGRSPDPTDPSSVLAVQRLGVGSQIDVGLLKINF